MALVPEDEYEDVWVLVKAPQAIISQVRDNPTGVKLSCGEDGLSASLTVHGQILPLQEGPLLAPALLVERTSDPSTDAPHASSFVVLCQAEALYVPEGGAIEFLPPRCARSRRCARISWVKLHHNLDEYRLEDMEVPIIGQEEEDAPEDEDFAGEGESSDPDA